VRGRLSRDVIVARAVQVADAEGLEAVTIRRIAQEHGVTPMAMYWHFNDKESLLNGIAEYLVAAVDLPGEGPADRDWADELRDVLVAFLEAIRPHPAIAGLALQRILTCEPGLAVAERALALLRRAGLSPERASMVGSFLLSGVITLVTAQPGPKWSLTGEDREEAIRHKRAGLEALSPTRYPNVVAAAPFLVMCMDQDEYFTTGVELLIQGVRGHCAV
jgi:TetR/AcrR family tetracycline transcriptional repressor